MGIFTQFITINCHFILTIGMNLDSSINLKKMWKCITIIYVLVNCCHALQLRDIIEPDVIDDFINDVDISTKNDKGSEIITEQVQTESKNDNEKDVNVKGHEQVSIAESGMMDNATVDDDSVKIQE